MRIVASLTAMLVLAATGLVSASASSSESLLAIVSGDGQTTLLHVDAHSLAPLPGPKFVFASSMGAITRSPDRTLLAFGHRSSPSVTFVDIGRMEVVSTIEVAKAGTADLAAWPTPTRLFGFTWGCCPVRTDLIIVDPAAGKVVARRPVTGSGWPRVALPGGLVYLGSPARTIGRARVVVVDLDGNQRSVILDRIRAGTKWRTVRGVRIPDIRQPGLTADPSGRTAYVVAPDGLVAEVDLETSGVTYHSVEPRTRRLTRAQKWLNGPMRYARWIGEDRIAVSGTDAKIIVPRSGAARQTWKAIGVSLIDTRSWRSRMIDPQAGGFERAPDGLLLMGSQSFTAYDLDGAARFTISIEEPLMYVSVIGDYGYAWGKERTVTIVDLRSGAIVARVPKPQFWIVG